MMNQRDLELLSSYLDGQLKSDAERARLEARLSREPDLRAVLDDLRSARGLLRRLPLRKAPRNFTLTPKMVGKNPPLPRAYPAFRFVSALATLLFFFTLGLNFLAPQIASQAPAGGFGGGGAPDIAAAEAPAATQAPALQAPSAEMVPLPTQTFSAEDSSRNAVETPADKYGLTEEPGILNQAPANAQPVPAETRQPIPTLWEFVLAGVALLSALIMLLMRQAAMSRWQRKS